MPPKGSKAAAKDTAGEGPSKKQKTGDKATKAETTNNHEVIPAQDALPATRVKLANGGQGILLGFRVPKDYFLATGAGDTNEASLLCFVLTCLLDTFCFTVQLSLHTQDCARTTSHAVSLLDASSSRGYCTRPKQAHIDSRMVFPCGMLMAMC